MKITDKIVFDESKPLSQQTLEFKTWYNEHVNPCINDTLKPDILDEYKRPALYSVLVDGFIVEVQPIYKNQSQSDWGCSDFQINIKTV